MTVTGGSALAKEDIDRMVREAESHAEEDRKRRESVDMRNEGDALVFRTEKLLKENADSIGEETKAPVVEAVDKLKEALKGEDNDAVKAAIDDLNTKAAAMGQAMYAAAQAKAETSQQASEADSSAQSGDGTQEDVVDAEIVDDEDSK